MPEAIVAVAGFTAIATKSGALVVNVAALIRLVRAAVIVAFPCARAVAEPRLLIVAVFGLDEFHITELVRSLLLPSV